MSTMKTMKTGMKDATKTLEQRQVLATVNKCGSVTAHYLRRFGKLDAARYLVKTGILREVAIDELGRVRFMKKS